jgi:hypothetical protein
VADRDIELIPGVLRASVMLQDVTWGDVTVPCWTAVTVGMRPAGQAEIAVCLVRDSDDPSRFPPRFFKFFEAVHELAREGRIVEPGGMTWLGGEDPFGLGPFQGVAYEVSPDFGLGPETLLCAVLLTEPELEMAQVSSTARVLTRLGHLYRYFPFPFWTDPARSSVFDPGDADQSILRLLPQLVVADGSATLSGSQLRVVVPLDAASVLATELREGRPLALIVGRDPAAPAMLTWRPGQADPIAINADGSDGSHIAAIFVAFVPAPAPVDDVRFQEDGFVVLLAEGSGRRLVDALTSGRPCELDGGEYRIEVVPAAG